MVPLSNVEFSEEAFPSEVSCKQSDVWEGINIPNRPCVQCLVILDRSQGAIFLFNEEEGGRIRGF